MRNEKTTLYFWLSALAVSVLGLVITLWVVENSQNYRFSKILCSFIALLSIWELRPYIVERFGYLYIPVKVIENNKTRYSKIRYYKKKDLYELKEKDGSYRELTIGEIQLFQSSSNVGPGQKIVLNFSELNKKIKSA